MAGFEIVPLASGRLAESLEFIHREVTRSPQFVPAESSIGCIESEHWARLRAQWLSQGKPLGILLVDGNAQIAGCMLYHHFEFRQGDRILKALGSGAFYVSPQATLHGFFMFRKYLKEPGYDFYYCTTSNAQSGALWARCGGIPLPLSREEWVRLCAPGSSMMEVALRRKLPGCLCQAFGLLSMVATPFFRVAPRNTGLDVEPCHDFDRLASIANRCLEPGLIAPDYSAEGLRTTYAGRIGENKGEIFRFRDALGAEGWFSISLYPRGSRLQIRSATLLDLVWPRNRIGFDTILQMIETLLAPQVDVIQIRPRPGYSFPRSIRWQRRIFPEFTSFIVSGSSPVAPSSTILDVPVADHF